MKKISVLIADDHKMARQALSFILRTSDQFELIAECESGEEAVEKAQALQPEVVIMDVNLPGSDGIETTGKMLEVSPGSKILGMSMHTQPSYAQSMMQKGARGYITKNSSKDEILKAVLEVYDGKEYLCEEIKNSLSD